MISSYNIVNDISRIVSGLGVTSSEAAAQMVNYENAERAALARYNSLITESEDVKHQFDVLLTEYRSYINYAKRQREEAVAHISNAESYETKAGNKRANAAELRRSDFNALQNEVNKMSSDYGVYVRSGQQNSSNAASLMSKIQAKSQELQKANEYINNIIAEAAELEAQAASERELAAKNINNAVNYESTAATKLQAYESAVNVYNALINNAESEAAAVEQAKAAYLAASQDYKAALIAEQKAAEAAAKLEQQRKDAEEQQRKADEIEAQRQRDEAEAQRLRAEAEEKQRIAYENEQKRIADAQRAKDEAEAQRQREEAEQRQQLEDAQKELNDAEARRQAAEVDADAAEAERVNIENQRQDVEQKLQEQSAEINALDKESEKLQEKLKKLQDDLKREKEKKQQSDSDDTTTERTENIKKYVRYGLVAVLILLLFSDDDDKKKKFN